MIKFNPSFFLSALFFLGASLFAPDAMGQACVGDYIPDGDEMPCGEPGIPCCSEPFACNGPNSPCNNYDPDFQDTGGCDLSCTAGCMDEEAENYDAGADYEDGTCVYPTLDECDAIYNPDSNCDSLINYEDFLEFLGLFGENFIPPLPANTTDSIVDWNDVFVDSLSFLEWTQGIEEQISACCGANTPPSAHGIFDSEVDGVTFEVTNAFATVSIELWGASGGDGGSICGLSSGSSSCNLCNGVGGNGGRALKMNTLVYNLVAGDVFELVASSSGADSDDSISCTPGFNGWNNWVCGPSEGGEDAGSTQLMLNGEVIAEISGGTGGTGACIGCLGNDGCFNGIAGNNGTLVSSIAWMTILGSETIEVDTGSRVIFRY